MNQTQTQKEEYKLTKRINYDDIAAEKKRIYYINKIKPSKEGKATNPKGRPRRDSCVSYKNENDFEKATKATITRLQHGACLQPITMERYGLDKIQEYVIMNNENILEYSKLPSKQLGKNKKLEIVVKSLLFHIMETKIDIQNESFSATIKQAVELLKKEARAVQ